MERGTGLPGTPHTIHTYICCRCRTAEAAMLPPPQCSGSNQLQWYSTVAQYMVQCGTVWYSMVHSGRPTTDLCCRSLAAAERGAATASPLWATDAYLHIYVSKYLQYLRTYVSTETRHRNFSDKIRSVRFHDLSIYLLTKSKYGCGYII